MVDYNGLENRRTERYRGFESLSLRQEFNELHRWTLFLCPDQAIFSSDFNSKSQTVKGDKELNEFLKVLKLRMYSIETTLMGKDVNVSIDTVIDVTSSTLQA